MSQQYIQIGRSESKLVTIHQPDLGTLKWSYETTYTSGSTRNQSGVGRFTEMFTAQSFAYEATDLTTDEVSQILKIIVGGKYYLHTFNPYSGEWETIKCYSGQGDVDVGRLKENGEQIDSLSFNAIAINPLL